VTVSRPKEETWFANILEQLNFIPSLMFRYSYFTLSKNPNLFTWQRTTSCTLFL